MKRGFWPGCGMIFCLIASTHAEPLDADDDHFRDGRFEAMAGQSVFFSPAFGTSRPTVDYTCTEIGIGYMFTDAFGPTFLRGNLEVIGSFFAGPIFRGHGNYVAGFTGGIRYNILMPDRRFIPYLSAGPGVTETDVDDRIEGENFNFNLNLAAGVRYRVGANWSINLECRYQHISNAHLARPNAGIDALGPVCSVSYFF